MARYCTQCGKELIEGAKVCGNCGAPVEGVKPENTNNYSNTNQVQKTKTNGMAVAGFVTTLVSTFLCCGAFNIIGLILSIIGLAQAKNYDGNGKGFAIAGIVISSVLIVLAIILYVLFFSFGFAEELREL